MFMNKAREVLQPSLLDRLKDDQPHLQQEAASSLVFSKAQLRDSVLRDLENLLNATCLVHGQALKKFPAVASSILAYGMPPIAGQLASLLDVKDFERTVSQTISRFEPRIIPSSLEVRAQTGDGLLDSHNVIGLNIRAALWAQPYPVELVIRSEVDLETGRVALIPLTGF